MIAAASPPVTDIFALFAGLFILTGLVAGLKNVVERSGMKRPIVTITAAFLCSAVAATAAPPVTFDSPCECHDNHGEHRWAVKNDPSTPPTDASAIQAITPSDVFSWPGPVEHLTQSSERTGIENNWFALTGRVVALKVEADGDLHIALQDATGDKPGIVVVEVPAKPQWCEIRNTVFSWTHTRFPFHTSSSKKLTLDQSSRRHRYRQGVLRCRSFSQRSTVKPEKPSSRLRSVGNSSGDEN